MTCTHRLCQWNLLSLTLQAPNTMACRHTPLMEEQMFDKIDWYWRTKHTWNVSIFWFQSSQTKISYFATIIRIVLNWCETILNIEKTNKNFCSNNRWKVKECTNIFEGFKSKWAIWIWCNHANLEDFWFALKEMGETRI